MSNPATNTHKVFSSRTKDLIADQYVGEFGRLFYDEPVGPGVPPVLRYSDGVTVGGIPISAGGGGSGGVDGGDPTSVYGGTTPIDGGGI